jgi:hypothetical protein
MPLHHRVIRKRLLVIDLAGPSLIIHNRNHRRCGRRLIREQLQHLVCKRLKDFTRDTVPFIGNWPACV